MVIQKYDPKREITVKWNAVDKRLRTLIAEGDYLTAEEKAQYAELERDYAGLEGSVPLPVARYGFSKPPAQETVPEEAHPVLSSYEDYEAVKQAHPDDMVTENTMALRAQTETIRANETRNEKEHGEIWTELDEHDKRISCIEKGGAG